MEMKSDISRILIVVRDRRFGARLGRYVLRGYLNRREIIDKGSALSVAAIAARFRTNTTVWRRYAGSAFVPLPRQPGAMKTAGVNWVGLEYPER